MRLTETQLEIIKSTITEIFGDDSSVYLFGSRTDDKARGGDIDLLVETPLDTARALEKKLRTQARLCMRLGDQKIDLITTPSYSNDSRSVVREAVSRGVKL
jgi:predicted nucleotidyltransferase